jgi:acyl dehydratase
MTAQQTVVLGRNLTDPSRAARKEDLEAGLKPPVFDSIVIPEEFGPVDLLVDDLKVKRFAFTQDDHGDWYLRAGPYGPRVGQAGLLANDLLQLFTLKYAASQVVGLHTEEELCFERPVLVGQRVRLAGRYVDKYERRGQGYVVMEADARDDEGRTLVRHRGVEIMRTTPGEVAGRGSAGRGTGRRVSDEYDTSLPLARSLGGATPPGTGLEPLHKELTFEQMAVFSRTGEFVTNIHNDLGTARAGGLTVPIVQGQQLVCYLTELLTRGFGAEWFSTGRLHVKFLRPVSAFDRIEAAGAVRETERDGPRTHVRLDVWVRRGDKSLAAVGWAHGTVPADRPGQGILTPEGN